MPKRIDIPKEKLEPLVKQRLTIKQICEKLGVCDTVVNRSLKIHGLIIDAPPRKHSPEMKQLLREKRLQYLANNPDKHVWKRHSKFKSEPCENVKKFLIDKNISFISEYSPMIENRNFSIDIAMPDKMIGIEVNGNQHYEQDGKLKGYYLDRQLVLERNGWTIYQIHYSACFNLEKWSDFLNQLLSSPIKVKFDYFNYQPREKKSLYNECSCGELKYYLSVRCRQCVSQTSLGKQKTKEEEIFYKLTEPEKISIKNNPKNKICECGNKKYFLAKRCIICHNKAKQLTPSLCECGDIKRKESKLCRNCNNKRKKPEFRKVIRPTKEELEILIWRKPMTQIGKDFGVSDNAIKKWCKDYEITNFPGLGYWRKVATGKIYLL